MEAEKTYTAADTAAEYILERMIDIEATFDLSRGPHVEPGSWRWQLLLARQRIVDAMFAVGRYGAAMKSADALLRAWKAAKSEPKDWRHESGLPLPFEREKQEKDLEAEKTC